MLGFGFRQKMTVQTMSHLSRQMTFKPPIIAKRSISMLTFSPERNPQTGSKRTLSPSYNIFTFGTDNTKQPNVYDGYK